MCQKKSGFEIGKMKKKERIPSLLILTYCSSFLFSSSFLCNHTLFCGKQTQVQANETMRSVQAKITKKVLKKQRFSLPYL